MFGELDENDYLLRIGNWTLHYGPAVDCIVNGKRNWDDW